MNVANILCLVLHVGKVQMIFGDAIIVDGIRFQFQEIFYLWENDANHKVMVRELYESRVEQLRHQGPSLLRVVRL